MICGHFGGPGAHVGGPGPHFEEFSGFCDFRGAPGAKVHTHFEAQMQPVTYFCQCCFFDVFPIVLFLIFCDFECPEAPFWLPF